MSREEVSNYLHKVFEAEISLFQQRQIIERLTYEKNNIRASGYEPEEKIKKRYEFVPCQDDIWETMFIMSILWFMVATFAIILDGGFIRDIYNEIKALGISWPFAYIIVAILLPICLMIFVGFIIDIYHSKKYSQYLLETQRRNEIRKQNNDRVMSIRENKKSEISYRIEEIKKYYIETNSALEKLYSANIIYEKYRNMIAVGMFCEYFDSGRCTSLEGHEGAYNIFENEIRQNIIIDKLDVIITKLEKIAQNQYMIYHSIQDSNRKIQEMSNEILSSSQSIQQNQKVIEYYNSITAKNTEFLKWERIFSIM